MSRLTERDEYDYIHDEQGCAFTYSPIHFCGDCYIGEVIDKLAEYEDAEEQGLLLRLPCNVGDTVYWICGRQISDVVVYGFRVENNKVFLLDYAGFPFGIMGVDSFLTKEEAEQKLAEMKGE